MESDPPKLHRIGRDVGNFDPLVLGLRTGLTSATTTGLTAPVSIAIELALIVLLSIANGLFSAAEIAVLSVRKSRLAELIAIGDKRAARVQGLHREPERFLATVQIGITVIGAAAAAFGGATLSRRLAGVLHAAGLTRYTEELSVVIVVLFVSYLSLVLGELVPKSLALRGAERYSLLVAGPLARLASLARPLVWLLTASSNLVLRIFGDRTSFTEARLSAEELKQLVEDAADGGTLEAAAGEIAARAIGFGALRVDAVMIPRSAVRAVPSSARAPEVDAIVASTPEDRIVVRGEADDDIGYLTLRDLFELSRKPERTARDLARAPHYVPTSALAVDVLREMQKLRCHLAFVVDEQGTVVGIVTSEEMIEEVVGDIFAEHESITAGIQIEGERCARLLGSTAIHHVNRALDIALPTNAEWSTVAGLVVAKLGAIPKAGAKVALDRGVEIEVLEASQRRVQSVRITWAPPPDEAP